jgi:Mor family transcriptional regulator
MNKRDAERIARAAAKLEAAREQRDALIRELHDGNSIRELAGAAGLSPARVHQILREEKP